ncbi:hypothetical protein L1987_50880 [Smallanthus sonchifolius]|uniref:Uncharacterized protein n=1 Tax=Smallanthus sonchifolius TaxID=185202 RepID=A0ACB9ENU9_9ASTR|nr:hypothetical protein L1987_50880 [Smallanthus sonchifolius]
MGKMLWIEDEEQLDKSHPGCMYGIFNVKKILPHRKHEALIKHAKGDRRYKRISDYQDSFAVLNIFDAKTSHILVDQSNRKTIPTQKGSLKARIKTLISEDNDKEQDQDFVSSPKLQRTYSIHHSETNEWVHPIIFFPENVTESTASSKTHVNFTNLEVNGSHDILDMFEVDKEVFINTLQERSLSSDTKPKLTKSGSFPTAYKSVCRTLMPMKLKDKLNEVYTVSKSEKTKNSNDDLNSSNIIRLRRISSLNESADGYTRFLDFSVSKEATLRTSRSLKLTNGSENLLKNNLNQESHDTYFLRSSSQSERNQVTLLLNKEKYAELNSTQDCESFHDVMDKSDTLLENEHSPKANSPAFCEDAYGLKVEEDYYQLSGETTQESPVLVPEYCLQDEKVQISKGFQENVEKEIKTVNNKKYKEASMKDDDFTYVKKILERSGFMKNDFQQTWYSFNQLLDPFVFQEIESHYFHNPERFAEEVNELSHRLLLFDLVDEALLTMYERSLTYYPKKLSSLCHICPVPTGSLVLDEVWSSVSRLLNFKHDINESLNDIVSRDLRSDDGWMNLQLDSECVGSDLEDLILDEVLDEMVFELI